MLDWFGQWHNWPFLLSLFVGMGLVALSFVGHGKDADTTALAKPDGLHLAPFVWLGAGKVPISVLLEVLLVSFGLTGLLLNALTHDLLPQVGAWLFPLSLTGAVLMGGVTTRLLADTLARFAPGDAGSAQQAGEWVGAIGVAVSRVTRSIGQVRVPSPDSRPDALVNACVDPEFDDEIPRDTEVYLVRYAESGLYHVRPLPPSS